MAEHDPNDELSVEELEGVAGGSLPPPDDEVINGNCVSCPNTNCPCT